MGFLKVKKFMSAVAVIHTDTSIEPIFRTGQAKSTVGGPILKQRFHVRKLESLGKMLPLNPNNHIIQMHPYNSRGTSTVVLEKFVKRLSRTSVSEESRSIYSVWLLQFTK